MQAFRLIAMGRPNHPIADNLADALVQVFTAAAPTPTEIPASVVTDAEVQTKRRKKAD